MFSANENLQLRQYKRQIVQHVEDCIPEDVLDLGVNVMVMQVSCKAPGCVPLETAIIIVFPTSSEELLSGLPESKGGSYKTKILKPMAEVTKQDVMEALPPAFMGGLRSVEKLCLNARDVMLGQITQLFGDEDVDGRRLMALYLQKSLQDYMDRDCLPPEWGEPFPELQNGNQKEEVAAENRNSAAKDESKDEKQAKAAGSSGLKGTGNLVIRRPIDEDDDSAKEEGEKVILTLSTAASKTASIPISTNKFSLAPPSVDSVTRKRQQQAASRQLNKSGNILSRLAEREHAPGLRRPGCPCCDPDNPSNVIDQMMQL